MSRYKIKPLSDDGQSFVIYDLSSELGVVGDLQDIDHDTYMKVKENPHLFEFDHSSGTIKLKKDKSGGPNPK